MYEKLGNILAVITKSSFISLFLPYITHSFTSFNFPTSNSNSSGYMFLPFLVTITFLHLPVMNIFPLSSIYPISPE